MIEDLDIIEVISYVTQSIRDTMRAQDIEISEEAIEVFTRYHVTVMMGVINDKANEDLEGEMHGSKEERIIN